ncbi:MAG: hypothetical protein E2O84_05960 [Bacteroidetes bacterium]|nr:MAG: hypothetical protein E2O84_05960 [Bacteroidota bacterium]
MNWEMIGSIGEITAGIGVILSLIYVGKQLKQSNTMARSSFRQELSSQANHWAMSIASSPSLAEALAKVHFEDLERNDATGPERMHIAYAIVGLVGQMFFAFKHWKEGILTDEQFAELYSPRNALLSKPYLSTVWSQLRPGYSEEFNEWFEQWIDLGDSEFNHISSN